MGISGSFLDSYDNLDHFLYRQYIGNEGRWVSPDPAGLAAVDPTNPQTWNRYAYVANSPISLVDPLGLLLKGPGNTCVGDTNGIVCGSGGFEGGGDGGGGSGGLGGFCDASGNCQGIAMCPDGTCPDPSNPFGYVGGTFGFDAINLPGAIQFGAAAFSSDYKGYLTGLATTIKTTTYLDTDYEMTTTEKLIDTQYLAFLKDLAPTFSPTTPGVRKSPVGKQPNPPCDFFPTVACFHLRPPNSIFTMGNTAAPFWDLLGQ
jgi:RHS repeat-associated protein